MVDLKTVTESIKAAREFIARAELVNEVLTKDKHAGALGTKETSALRRQSMELTRILSKLRKSS